MKVKFAIVLPMLVVLIGLQSWMQTDLIWPYWKKYYAPRTDTDLSALSPDQMLFALAGFREMIAGLLWVRADSYFDEGNYDAILPMIRIVTMLDPKQIDVYSTGMWHIAYNFTDEAQRSDRRYISPALALGKEGSEHNDYTYEIFFETGWIWFHKIDDDYGQAVHWFQLANEREFSKLKTEYLSQGMTQVEADYYASVNSIPTARRNLLSKALLRNGQVLEALDLYADLLAEAEIEVGEDELGQPRQNRDTIENNMDNLMIRMSARGEFARLRGVTDFTGYDIDPPFEIGFSAKVTVLSPKVILVEGTWNVMPVGTRVRFILRDKVFDEAVPGGMNWERGGEVDFTTSKDETFLMDQLFVKNQRFSRRIDMSRDVTMYPMTSDEYVLEFYYNPRSAPAHIQDKFGFNGEGMTDANYLDFDAREGQRVIFASLEISRDQLLQLGKYRDGMEGAFVQTDNYQKGGSGVTTSEVIQVPGLRSGG